MKKSMDKNEIDTFMNTLMPDLDKLVGARDYAKIQKLLVEKLTEFSGKPMPEDHDVFMVIIDRSKNPDLAIDGDKEVIITNNCISKTKANGNVVRWEKLSL
jgi:hypothetical protein